MTDQSHPRGAVLVIGAGPGVGAAVARRFGRKGHPVGLVARNRDRLDAMRGQLREEGIDAAFAVANGRRLTTPVSPIRSPRSRTSARSPSLQMRKLIVARPSDVHGTRDRGVLLRSVLLPCLGHPTVSCLLVKGEPAAQHDSA